MMNAKMFLSTIALVSACIASAKTTSWKGAATGSGLAFANADNWSNGVPQPGDTVVISTTGTAYNKPVNIGIDGETFDIGSAGLTFDVSSSYTKLLVNFTGTGKIVKTGPGRLGFGCNSDFSGGTEVQAGRLEPWKNSVMLSFGTGIVELASDGSVQPGFSTDVYGTGIGNALEFTGQSDSYIALSSGQPFTFGGTVSAAHDVSFKTTGSGKLTFNGVISAPGCVFMVDSSDARNTNVIAQTVNANVKATGTGLLRLSGNSPNTANVLAVENGNCEISSSAFWGGDIALSGSTANLTLKSSANLSPSTIISIADDCTGKLYIAGSITVKILSVGGVPVEDGTYTAANLAAVIGSGTLVVSSAKRTVWIGEVTGNGSGATDGTPESFLDPANWDNGVPSAGDTIVVTNSTSWNKHVFFGTNGETLDIGSKGITIDNSGQVKCAVAFSGSGKITKLGSATFGATVDSVHTGGTEIYAGAFAAHKASLGFGTGPITFIASGTTQPKLSGLVPSGAGLTNALAFRGAVAGYNVFSVGQRYALGGDVSSEHDFEIEETLDPLEFNGSVSAPDHTFTIKANRTTIDSHNPDIRFAKSVDTDIVKTGNRTMTMNGVTTNPDNLLTVLEGTCSIAAAGYWGGTNIVVGASAVALVLNGDGNLSPEAVLGIDTTGGAKIEIASGVKIEIAKLHVNGIYLKSGVYSAENLPTAISGGGKLKVGVPGFAIFVR